MIEICLQRPVLDPPQRLRNDPPPAQLWIWKLTICGDDPLTGTNFDHRQQWLVDRMKTLAAVFAVDICSYSMLSTPI